MVAENDSSVLEDAPEEMSHVVGSDVEGPVRVQPRGIEKTAAPSQARFPLAVPSVAPRIGAEIAGIHHMIREISGTAKTIAEIEALGTAQITRMTSPLMETIRSISQTSALAAARLQPFQDAATRANETLREMHRVTEARVAAVRVSQIAEAANRSIAIIGDLQRGHTLRNAAVLGAFRPVEWPMLKVISDIKFPKIQMPDLGDGARVLSLLISLQDGFRRGHEAFEVSEYYFLEEFVSGSFTVSLGRFSPSRRDAEVSDRMWRLSRTPAFRRFLHNVCHCHVDLAARWPVISEGLSVHQDGRFHAAACTLVPQMEGVLMDVMLARGEAVRQGQNCYALGPDGNILRQPGKSNKIVLSGLSQKISHCHPTDAPMLHTVNDRFMRHLSRIRNNLLHGQHRSLISQEFSTRLVWALYALAFAAALEFVAQDAMRSASLPPTEAREMAEARLDNASILLTHEVFSADL